MAMAQQGTRAKELTPLVPLSPPRKGTVKVGQRLGWGCHTAEGAPNKRALLLFGLGAGEPGEEKYKMVGQSAEIRRP